MEKPKAKSINHEGHEEHEGTADKRSESDKFSQRPECVDLIFFFTLRVLRGSSLFL